ncbi:MAG: hypothetical protein APF78_05725 [Sphingomonadales bacterium BRH_c3]|nr:MAG: hypothetical protein APF78_05725 [Sphingomonadales bacterium BRH_c3]
MTMRNLLLRLIRDERGMAAEFALVLPLLILFVLGTIEAGVYAWRLNQGEKATQWGARFAAVTNPVAEEITDDSYIGRTINSTFIGQGDRIPIADFVITCTSAGTTCSCTGSDCVRGTYTKNAIAFDNLTDRMQLVYPEIAPENVQIEYAGSGLGFAGDPNGPDMAPLITVRLTGMSYTPISLNIFGGTVNLPDFAYSITAEDSSGTASN